jgi:hypothetical protein
MQQRLLCSTPLKTHSLPSNILITALPNHNKTVSMSNSTRLHRSMQWRIVLFFTAIIFYSFNASAQPIHYPDKSFPTSHPAVFSRGFISDGMNNRDFTISVDGTEIFYTIQHKDFLTSTIITVKRTGATWSKPEVASFSGMYNDIEASFTPDGKKIYFSSNRPVDAADSTEDYDIWYVEKANTGWGEPVHAGFVINSPKNEFYPSVTKSGNIYFTTEFEHGKGKEDIVVCEWKDGKYQSPQSLSEAINSKGYEYNAFVDPDERFIIFTGDGRKENIGRGDLYISKKDESGNWMAAKNMGAIINSKSIDYCPYVSPDKKYLFFTSARSTQKTPFKARKTFAELQKMLQNAGNGLEDIYWIRFDELYKEY